MQGVNFYLLKCKFYKFVTVLRFVNTRIKMVQLPYFYSFNDLFIQTFHTNLSNTKTTCTENDLPIHVLFP